MKERERQVEKEIETTSAETEEERLGLGIEEGIARGAAETGTARIRRSRSAPEADVSSSNVSHMLNLSERFFLSEGQTEGIQFTYL